MLILQPWLSIPKFLYLNFRSPLYYTLATNGSHATIDLAYHFRSPLHRSQQLHLLSGGFFLNFNLDPAVEYPFLATLIPYPACILWGLSFRLRPIKVLASTRLFFCSSSTSISSLDSSLAFSLLTLPWLSLVLVFLFFLRSKDSVKC